MILQILILLFGFGLLIKGADWLVNGASSLARKYKVSDLAIGLTIVAFGTSAPELVVNAFASFNQHPDLVFGNIIGSNNFNLFLVLGITGLIAPLSVQSSTTWKEIPMSFFAIVALYFLANFLFDIDTKVVTRLDGFILLIFFGLFLFYVYRQMKANPRSEEIVLKEYSNLKIWVLIIAGLTGLVIGGKLVVNSAVEIASSLGVSEKIIGLTIVAIGTSLPELATSLVASFRKNNDLAIGNIIGSNIFNILLILSFSSIVRPLPYNTVFNTDLYLLFAGTAILFIAMFTSQKRKLDRWEAGVLLSVYVFYTIFLIVKEI